MDFFKWGFSFGGFGRLMFGVLVGWVILVGGFSKEGEKLEGCV